MKILLTKEREKANTLEKEREELVTEKKELLERIERLKLQAQSGPNTGNKGVTAAVKQDKKILEALSMRSQALEVRPRIR